jgi:phage portal protein BeeE
VLKYSPSGLVVSDEWKKRKKCHLFQIANYSTGTKLLFEKDDLHWKKLNLIHGMETYISTDIDMVT